MTSLVVRSIKHFRKVCDRLKYRFNVDHMDELLDLLEHKDEDYHEEVLKTLEYYYSCMMKKEGASKMDIDVAWAKKLNITSLFLTMENIDD